MSFLLDTNVCIRFLTGRSPAVVARLRRLDAREVRLSSVVKAELLHGARKSARPAENLRLLAEFFAPFASLPFDDRAAEHYGAVRAEIERLGTPIEPKDLLIAATALAHEATVVSHDVDEFRRVAGLRIEDWES